MSVLLPELVRYCEDLLSVSLFRDYCPNGLQVEGRQQVNKIVSGVTASQSLLDAAVAMQADLILVHHGYFWKGENERVVGIKKQRLSTLLCNDISLLAFHLPLDAHAELGNNAQLAKKMHWNVVSGLDGELGQAIGMVGELTQAQNADQFSADMARVLNRPVQHIQGINRPIKKIAWCTGAAQGYIEKALERGVDAYISGEISEQTVHVAREAGIDYFAAGHHATERYGVQALGEHLKQHFGVEHCYVEIDNPV
ncbi:Nif3-like dinuclear metal center hexameric protein [Neptunomonas qingdaonensis]|uniref:GTP cyclohydrolase 1 type 2 homolog n=1 Tax=Neptunomonas qingdaonensis TaxID=1045558 RepID=A0A1I2UL19_9GAMM|nr:Nif3-like dinuclear metal center hexameric protein [Neptunomonas qingdaonensis]SFG76337.1 dinuclear metal center protein, YbgI/SA1388 family [Neptunomonas qingdaonensis]